jgi:5-methyltetrahydrofolate--homocysteine methyltransferase
MVGKYGRGFSYRLVLQSQKFFLRRNSMSTGDIFNAILSGDAADAEVMVQEALDDGVPVGDILNQGCIAAMSEIGRRFENGEAFVPEMLISARAMQAAMKLLKPLLTSSEVSAMGKVVIGTVAGDLHDIGKNLVSMMMEGSGFEVIDLGSDVSAEKFISALQEQKPDIIAMSSLLTTTMPSMEATIEALVAAGVREQVKVLIGGAPVTMDYAVKIGADGYAPDASSAARKAKELLGTR